MGIWDSGGWPLVPITILLMLGVASSKTFSLKQSCEVEDKGSVHDFSIPSLFGDQNITFAHFKGKQEPGANADEIFNCIKYVRPGKGFEPNFNLTQKIEVNGDKEHPLYTFLKASCPTTQDKFSDVSKLLYTPLRISDIRWNWEKFLIDGDGRPVTRFHSSITPDSIAEDICNLQSKLEN